MWRIVLHLACVLACLPLASGAAELVIEAESEYSLTVAVPPCNLLELPLGGTCNDGSRDVVYVGSNAGIRLYTTNYQPDPSNFSGAYVLTDALSASDGLQNTNKLIARNDTTFPMAQNCRALGNKWYLGAINELSVLYANKTAVKTATGMPTGGAVDVYYSSSDFNTNYAYHLNMSNGEVYYFSHPKILPWTFRYRCFRRD